MKLRLIVLSVAFWSCGCSPGPDAWLSAATEIEVPAANGSRFPHLSAGPGGDVVISWLEPHGDDGFALKFARLSTGGWQPAAGVARGEDWFVNWADFPSVVPLGGQRLAAHWLQKTPGNVYAYRVRISVSEDKGRNWSAPVTPHADDTPTEHGFVSLFGTADRAMAVWLDGRNTLPDDDRVTTASGAMTLRLGALSNAGASVDSEVELDERVCDCCKTGVALTTEGPIVAYRDRSQDEIRDIAVVRRTMAGWSEPSTVHADGWNIDACPVNGPAIAARDSLVAVAWFTAPDEPRIRLAFSGDAGRSFAAPFEVAHGRVLGRVDLVLLGDGRAIVSWLAEGPAGAAIFARAFDRSGPVSGPARIVASQVGRDAGFPQMVQAGTGLLFAWTDPRNGHQVRAAYSELL